MKDALSSGLAIDGPQNGRHGTDLETDLSAPGFAHNRSDQIQIETKDSLKSRGFSSTNHLDALALTYAQNVAPKKVVAQDDGSLRRIAASRYISAWG